MKPLPLTVERASRMRYAVLATLCVLALITYIQRNGFASTGTDLKRELDLGTPEWSTVMSAFLFAYAVFEVPWGLLGDRLGVRHLLVLLVVCWSLATAALSLMGLFTAPGLVPFAVLLLLRFLFGAFQAGGFPAISRVLTDWMPTSERGTAQGLIWMCSRVGGALAPFVLLVRPDGTADWQVSFLLLASLGFVWCVMFWPWFRNRPAEMRRVNAAETALIAEGKPATATGHAHTPWALLFGSRSVWALCLMYGFGGFSANFFVTLLPAYLREEGRMEPAEMRWLAGLPLALGVAGCLVGGVVSDGIIRRWGNRRWGRRVTGLIGHAIAGGMLLAVSQAQGFWELAVLLAATFFCNDLAMGPAWACCADIGERHAATLGGTMNMFGNLGGALGTLVAGLLLGKVLELPAFLGGGTLRGTDLMFGVYACSFWLASLCWLNVDVTQPLKPSGTDAATPP